MKYHYPSHIDRGLKRKRIFFLNDTFPNIYKQNIDEHHNGLKRKQKIRSLSFFYFPFCIDFENRLNVYKTFWGLL